MAKRTVVHALLSYADAKGRSRMALRGSVVELSGEELERAERIGAVSEDGAELSPGPVLQPAPPVAADDAGKLLDAPAEKPATRKPAAKDSP
jgi:hypothetical protein